MDTRKWKTQEVYARLKQEDFAAYLAEDSEYQVYFYMGRRMMSVKVREDEKYVLISSDEFQSMFFDTEDSLFEVIFFVSHCQK